MKVWIKTRYRMDLTDGDVDRRSQRFELVGRKVAEVALYGPQFFKHDSRHPA